MITPPNNYSSNIFIQFDSFYDKCTEIEKYVRNLHQNKFPDENSHPLITHIFYRINVLGL